MKVKELKKIFEQAPVSEEEGTRVFTIEADEEYSFLQKIKPIVNKLKKYNLPVTVEKVKDEYEKTLKKHDRASGVNQEKTIKVVDYAIKGNFKFDGVEILGKRNILSDEDGEIINSLNNSDVPESYRGKKLYCDHCNKATPRKQSFIIRNKDGQIKQIGKSCLAEYTKVTNIQAIAQIYDELANTFDEHTVNLGKFGPSEIEWGDRFSKAKISPTPFLLLSIAYQVMQANGGKYVSKNTEDRYGPLPTAEATKNIYNFLSNSTENSRKTIEISTKKLFGFPYRMDLLPEEEQYIKDAIEWIKNQKNGEFENQRVLVKTKYLDDFKFLGYLVSILPLYAGYLRRKEAEDRRQESLKKNAESSTSTHVGNVGDKIKFEGTLKKSRPFETAFGTMVIHNFTDNSGNVYVWKTGPTDLEDGKIYSVKASIKDHSEYNGVKQTIITRAKAEKA
jgi:hypothetical protein